VDWAKTLEFIKALLKELNAPSAAMKIAAVLVLIAFAMKTLQYLLVYLGEVRGTWNEKVKPIFYDKAKKDRVSRRQRFADHMEGEIRRIDRQEDWRDYRFAELEAEVEAEVRPSRLLPWKRDRGTVHRRERSLSRALSRSGERLILLEGEPGAGKSVALRHVARQLATRAMTAPSLAAVIPLYINLKGLERKRKQRIDANLIHTYVIEYLTRINNREIEEILDKELDAGLADGTWLFLFDSFDEIPEVLGSTEADAVVRDYAEAIASFLRGANRCHGIIASRQFRGPKGLDWPRFKITTLSRAAQRDLIERADLGDLTAMTIGRLHASPSEIAAVARTPLFLGLVCEFVREHKHFPESAHSVFESYVSSRLERDEEQLTKRYGLEIGTVRASAEQIAFSMARDEHLGLSVTRGAIRDALVRCGLPRVSDKVLDALEYIKLARADNDDHGDARTFTFAHRRFQEYFATCVVLRDTDIVAPRDLLLNARWRETAVVIFQTQAGEPVDELVATAATLLNEMVVELRQKSPVTITAVPSPADDQRTPERILWPLRALHVLGLLQSGFSAARVGALPPILRAAASEIILTAAYTGTIADLRSALDVAGIVPQDALLWTMRRAFATKSRWVVEVAYRQVARLTEIPDDISQLIGLELLRLARTWRMAEERDATHAHLSRIDDPARFLASLKLLMTIRWLEPLLIAATLLLVSYAQWDVAKNFAMSLPGAVITGLITWYLARFLVTVVNPPIPLTTDLMISALGTLGAQFVEMLLVWSSIILRGILVLIAISPRASFLSLIALYFMTWTPAALVLIRASAAPRPVFYVAIPLLGLARVLVAAVSTLRRWIRYLISNPGPVFRFAGFMLGLYAVLGAIFGVVWLIARQKAVLTFFSIFGSIYMPFFIVGIVITFDERRRVASFRRARAAAISAAELIQLLASFRTPTPKLEILRDARRRQLLAPSFETESALRDAALFIERSVRETHGENLITASVAAVKLAIKRQKRQPSLGSTMAVAEELHRLADALESQRGGN
jgi:hypothetical protein